MGAINNGNPMEGNMTTFNEPEVPTTGPLPTDADPGDLDATHAGEADAEDDEDESPDRDDPII